MRAGIARRHCPASERNREVETLRGSFRDDGEANLHSLDLECEFEVGRDGLGDLLTRRGIANDPDAKRANLRDRYGDRLPISLLGPRWVVADKGLVVHVCLTASQVRDRPTLHRIVLELSGTICQEQ